MHSITEVPVCLDELMGSLRALDLTNNKLEGQLDPITTFFPRLQHLRVGNNQLTAIPDSICQLKDLQVCFLFIFSFFIMFLYRALKG